MIYYSLNFDDNIKEYKTLSHNSAEILSKVKFDSLSSELTKYEYLDSDERSKGRKFPYLI